MSGVVTITVRADGRVTRDLIASTLHQQLELEPLAAAIDPIAEELRRIARSAVSQRREPSVV